MTDYEDLDLDEPDETEEGTLAEIFYDHVLKQTDEAVLLRTHLGDRWIPKSVMHGSDMPGRVWLDAWWAIKEGFA